MNRKSGPRNAALLAVAAITALSVTGCGSDNSTASENGNGDVAAVIKGLDNPFFQQMEAGIEDGAKEGDVTVDVQAASDITDTTGQLDKLTSAATKSDVGCAIVNPIDGTNLITGMAQLAAKDVPIVNIDSPVDADAAAEADATPTTYIGTNNVDAGKLAGEHMVELLPDGGKVALVGGIAGDVTSNARLDGFTEGAGDGVTITQTVAANWNREEALNQATTLLRANPDLSGFFVANDDMALGVARAVSDVGRAGKVKIISVDGVEDGLNGVKAGELSALVAQYPYAIGEMGVNACRAAMAGEDLPENVTAPIALVTPDNVDDALASAPAPFEEYDDPFAALVD